LQANQQIITEQIKKDGELTMVTYKKGRLLGKGGFANCFELINVETN